MPLKSIPSLYQARSCFDAAGGGGFTPGTPCAGTVLHLADPNDLTQAASWTPTQSTPAANVATAPDGTPLAAGSLTSTAAGTSVSFIQSAIFTVTGGVTFSLSVYVKPVSGATDMRIDLSDLSANAVINEFDLTGGGTVIDGFDVGTGTRTCTQVTASASGWYYLTVAGSFSVTNTSMRAVLFMRTATVGNEFDIWNFGL